MSKAILLGNEAIARGAVEAGLDFASAYPGTPSSEIGDALAVMAKEHTFYYEYAVNEKVAMEMVAAASASNLRSLTCLKHVGLNVASDAFMSLAYTGVKGGLVVVCADDPSCHSSQNEQDNRYYAALANVPMLEPSDPQECYEMSRKVFDLSEKLSMPFLLRTTTRVNHTSSDVGVGEIEARERRMGHFEKDPRRFMLVPALAYRKHPELLERMKKAEKESERSEFNHVEGEGDDLGIITSGVSYLYVKEVLRDLGIKARVLKLGFTRPIPSRMCTDFLRGLKRVLIVEELEPFIEGQMNDIIIRENIDVEIHGKDLLPIYHEFDLVMIRETIAGLTGRSVEPRGDELSVPSRSPVLCPGCPHRNVYYVAKQLIKGEAIFPSDIGCYTLGVNDPYNEADFLLCMGSSIGTACGFSKATDQKIVSFIGDSTFYHGGIPALIDGVHNKAKFLLVILDNRITAMTGHQPTPGLNYNAMASDLPEVMPEDIARGCGVRNIEIADASNLRDIREKMKKLLSLDELGVLVTRAPCIIVENRNKRRSGEKVPLYEIDEYRCNLCRVCIDKFGCPAFQIKENRVWIAEDLCNGCGLCLQVCGRKAVRRRE